MAGIVCLIHSQQPIVGACALSPAERHLSCNFCPVCAAKRSLAMCTTLLSAQQNASEPMLTSQRSVSSHPASAIMRSFSLISCFKVWGREQMWLIGIYHKKLRQRSVSLRVPQTSRGCTFCWHTAGWGSTDQVWRERRQAVPDQVRQGSHSAAGRLSPWR